MRRGHEQMPRCRPRSFAPALATAGAVALLAVRPAPLLPIARGYGDLCDRYPALARVTSSAPPLPVALLLSLAALGFAAGGAAAALRLITTRRFNRRLRRLARPLPPRLAYLGDRLGLTDRLTYLAQPTAAAFCYGFASPRIALTAGLLARVDDEALAAVLVHERHHLRRRDPLRYLAIHALSAAAFAVPLTPAIRRRVEAGIEVAADRAALAVASPGALAAAFLAVLTPRHGDVVSAAAFGVTEARIAHLAGTPVAPAFPLAPALASVALLGVVVLAALVLATATDLVGMVCARCPWLA